MAALSTLLSGCGGGSGASASTRVGHGSHYRLNLGGYNGPDLTTKKVTLRFLRQSYSPQLNAFYASLYKKFNAAYPNITIAEELVPYGDLPTKVQLYVQAGNAPDIMMGRDDFTPAYAAGKLALRLNDYLTPLFMNDMWAPIRAAGSVAGSLYVFPWDVGIEAMFFNADLFKRAGVTVPVQPTDPEQTWTMEEWHSIMGELSSKLKSLGSGYFALAPSTDGNGGPGSNYTQHESMWIRAMGNPSAPGSTGYDTWQGVSPDGLKATGYVDTPEAIQGMTYYQSEFKNGYTSADVLPDQFTPGKAGLYITNIGLINNYARSRPSFKWGVMPFPKGAGGSSQFTCTASDAPFVSTQSKNPDEAAALLGYLCNDENRIQHSRLWGSFPARSSLIAKMREYDAPAPKLAIAMLQKSVPAPRTPGWFAYFNAMDPVVKSIAEGADPASKLHSAAAQIDGLLAKYK